VIPEITGAIARASIRDWRSGWQRPFAAAGSSQSSRWRSRSPNLPARLPPRRGSEGATPST
jgi:hypothetical protein